MSEVARVPERKAIPLCILAMAMRIDREWMEEQCGNLIQEIEEARAGIPEILQEYERIEAKIAGALKRAETLVEETTPVWDDSYNLCGDPECDGDCRICQDGEYDGEEDHTEKYCRRGRR